MAGLSKGAVVGLILKYIGGKMVIPSMKASIEGSAPVRQLGGFGGAMGLAAMGKVLKGQSLNSVVGNIYKNPVALVGVTALATVNATKANLVAQLGVITGTGENAVTLIPENQLNALTSSLDSLSTSMSTLNAHTDKMSGVVSPSYENQNEFGLSEVTSVISSVDKLKTDIPTGGDHDEIKTDLTSHVDDITAPLGMSDRVAEIEADIKVIEANLIAAAGTPEFDDIYASSMTTIAAYNAEISDTVNNSVGAMTRINEASEAASTISTTSNLINNGPPAVQAFMQNVVNPESIAEFKTNT